MLTWAKHAAVRRGEAVFNPPVAAAAEAAGAEDGGASPDAKRPRTEGEGAAGAASASGAAGGGGPTDDFLELYCGSGAFTAALAPLFRQCVATEISKPAVASAKENMRRNGIENVFLAPLSAEEFAEAYAGTRGFERLKGADLTAMDIRCVLVDPPRAGCGPDVMKILQQFPAIVYISCNPVRRVYPGSWPGLEGGSSKSPPARIVGDLSLVYLLFYWQSACEMVARSVYIRCLSARTRCRGLWRRTWRGWGPPTASPNSPSSISFRTHPTQSAGRCCWRRGSGRGRGLVVVVVVGRRRRRSQWRRRVLTPAVRRSPRQPKES